MLPKKAAFEVEAAPGQPIASYMHDHNVSTLRVLSGGYGAVDGKPLTIGPEAWTGAGRMVAGDELAEGSPPAAYRLVGKNNMVGPGNEAKNHFEAAAALPSDQRYRMAIRYHKQDCKVYENLCWEIDIELLDESGKVIAFDRELDDPQKMRHYQLPGEFRLQDPRSFTATTPWISSDPVYFDVPADARVSKIRGTLRAALYSHPPHGLNERSVLDLGEITIEPLGSVERRERDVFVTLAFPLEKQAPSPAVSSEMEHGTGCTKIPLDDERTDYLIIGRRKPLVFDGGKVAAQFALLRCRGGKVREIFARDAHCIVLERNELLYSDEPVDLSAELDEAGRIAGIHISAEQPTNVLLQGERIRLPAAAFVAGHQLRFRLDPARLTLEANSRESQALLQRGLAPLLKKIRAERDEPAAKGMKNLALGATVTASAVRDPRFPPQLVVDNETWEYPADGRLDYTQGELLTTPAGGYGADEAIPLSGGGETPMTSWPFYVRPTYWLLPYQTTGWIQLELRETSPVRLVRLLNTSNAGANDYATMKYHVELLDAQKHVVGRGQGEFGQAFDRPFKAAFMIPEAFSHYGPTFRGMLEPGVKVPFGDGWQSVSFDTAPRAKFVKVYIDSYWALGGGLNEIQVY